MGEMIERASLACGVLAAITFVADPWLYSKALRRSAAALTIGSATLFVIGGYYP